ncbi:MULTISPECIES: polysaccharide polymerase [unclassified Clostridioides]|uniref:polysaccharide polymerase n=1 Tax=unclassified Clostridioides TaxID=2635829 RepID=UPI001D101541|nr:polysaccharide polymerase [Clostridioides sp. ES-S-0001-02]MCC0680514.1 polysaccharide polymerase [Clostridioides sp. ES-S-0005-03]UDN46733.1 polysaccharide polymerase [Clostridioides sp. ES-S-0173-01]UDN61160.1 polysaccharide polymerase [Clostridioides sp. ES-W-0016-02]
MKTLNDDRNIMIKKYLYIFVLFIIVLRKYMISFIDPDLSIGIIKSALFYSSIGILMLLFLFDKKKSITEMVLVGACVLLYILNREGAILLIVLLAVSAKQIDDKCIVKSYLIISVCFLIGAILLFNLFPSLVFNQEVHYRYIGKLDTLVTRMDFGLGNPNGVFYYMVTIYAAYIFLRYKNYNKWDRIILFGSAFFVYQTTYSRTGFFTILAGLIFVEIIRVIDLKKIKVLPMLIKTSPIILTLFSVIIGMMFSKSSVLNRLLASRPKFWNVYLAQEGNFMKPFGNSYSAAIKATNPLDSSYIYIISVLGVIACILFMFLMYKGIQSFIEKDKKEYLVALFIFLLYSFAENLLLEASFSFTIVLLIKEVILNDKREVDLWKMKSRR